MRDIGFLRPLGIGAPVLALALTLALALAASVYAGDRPSTPDAATPAPAAPASTSATPTKAPAASPATSTATPPAAPEGVKAPAAPAGTPPLTEAEPPAAPKPEAAGPEEPAKTPKAAKKAAKPKVKYKTGEDPEFAKKHGWPVKSPPPPPGAILPAKRIVAYYGNPQSKRMGVLGQYPKEEMLRRLQKEVAKWGKADPAHPVQPALHLVAVVAQAAPGKAGKYRMIMPDKIVNKVYGWAQEAHAILFIDIQTGHDNIRRVLPRFEWLLKNPDVHLGMDPEFNTGKSGRKPGTKIGTYDAADVNYASAYLQGLVKKYHLPPKVLVVHRFTRYMVTNAKKIVLRPDVQIVMNMDGWGAPWLKRDSYRDYIVREPVQYTGFKLFYHNDTKKGDPLLTPKEILKLNPKPIYIQYQ